MNVNRILSRGVGLVICFALLLALALPAMAAPGFVCTYHGTVEVDGELVLVDTEVTAWLYRGTPEEVRVAGPVLTGEGVLPDYEYRLLVDLEAGVYEVHFMVDGLWANETYDWVAFDTIPADLTATTPDTTPPEVVSTVPVDDATGVAVNTVVSATFSEDIQEGDNFGDIAISGATGVSATIDGAILTIAHDDFAYGTLYEVTIPAGAVNDLAEPANALAEAYTWSFTTEEDITPPTVIKTSPRDGARRVPIDTLVTATFSEAMDSSTITVDSFTLAGSAVSGTVAYNSDTYTATFTPDADLDYSTIYIATLSTAITDEADNSLALTYTWSFTTGAKPRPPEEVEVEEEEEVSPKPELGPHVSVGNLRISPAEVTLNQPVTISLSVFNSGDRGGSKTLNLLINGELEQSTRVGIPAHGNKSFSFTVQRASPGVYSVYIEGASGWFTVSGLVAPSAPVEAGLGTGDVIAIVIIAIILIGGLTFAFLYIRRSA